MPNQIPIPLNFNSVRALLLDVCKQATDAMAYVQSIPQSLPLHEHQECLKHYAYLHSVLIPLHSDCVALVSSFYDLQQKWCVPAQGDADFIAMKPPSLHDDLNRKPTHSGCPVSCFDDEEEKDSLP